MTAHLLLDMTEEPVAETGALMRAFDRGLDTHIMNSSDTDAPYNAELGDESGKWIIGDLGRAAVGAARNGDFPAFGSPTHPASAISFSCS